MLAYACIRLHRSCIDACVCLHSPASMLAPALHRFCIPLHRCLHMLASMLTHACIRLHRCLHMLAFACIDACICLRMLAFACIDAYACLHSPASMLAYACIRLHRCLRMLAFACIDACIRLHRTEPTKGEARRLVRFSDQRIESTCETCDGTRGARTRAHPRPSSVLLRSFVAFSFLPVPPPFFLVLPSPVLSPASSFAILLVPVSLSPWSGALLVS